MHYTYIERYILEYTCKYIYVHTCKIPISEQKRSWTQKIARKGISEGLKKKKEKGEMMSLYITPKVKEKNEKEVTCSSFPKIHLAGHNFHYCKLNF